MAVVPDRTSNSKWEEILDKIPEGSINTLICDIEANGLLRSVNLFHCAGAIDFDTGQEYWFRPDQGHLYIKLLDKAKLIVFHKADYDVLALEKLFNGWVPKAAVRCSLVMSQVLNYNRFGFGHSLAQWGNHLGDAKIEYSGGFETFSEEMFIYLKQDVRLLVKVYQKLREELKWFIGMSGGDKTVMKAIRNEQEMGFLATRQSLAGWLINKPSAVELLKELEDKMTEAEEPVNKLLGKKVVKPDGMDKDTGYAKTKAIKVSKSGVYHKWLRTWFRLDDNANVSSGPVHGEFTRVEFVDCDIGNTDDVKRYLTTVGWEADEWNWKRVDGKLERMSAKLTDSSLERIGELGKPFLTYYTYRSRHSILKGWLTGKDAKTEVPHLDENDHLHGDVFNIGTPTFRQSHKVLVNLPSGKALYGPEMRSLFIAPKGYKLVSADSAACQLRLLAHYLDIPEFTKEVLEGDIHQKNADILGCSRDTAKPFIFAFLYGAGGMKLGQILGVDKNKGNALKRKFLNAYPFLRDFIDNMTAISNKQGFLIGLDGRPVYVGSPHKSLNYLIQSAEAIVMKATVIWIHKRFKEKGIDYTPCLFYHDEDTYTVREDQTETASRIIKTAFKLAPRDFGVDIMTCGDCKVDSNYYLVH